MFAAIFVWLELIVRDAAIYVAVLFFPAALAAAIWPALAGWPGRLGRLLMLFVILKPVALIVLSLAGNAAAAGLSFGGGVSGSVGTILAAIVIFALAAFAPWALMYLLAADAESAYVAAGAARGGAAPPSRDEHGRSVRNAGGLARPRRASRAAAARPAAARPAAGGTRQAQAAAAGAARSTGAPSANGAGADGSCRCGRRPGGRRRCPSGAESDRRGQHRRGRRHQRTAAAGQHAKLADGGRRLTRARPRPHVDQAAGTTRRDADPQRARRRTRRAARR